MRRLFPRRPVAEIARPALATIADGELLRLPLTLRFWDGSELAAEDLSPDAVATPTVILRRPRAISHLLYEPGELGLSRGFIDGSIATDGDLEALLSLRGRLQTVRLTAGDRVRALWAALRGAGPAVLRRPPVPATEAKLSGETHSPDRDREAIEHHYGVSNDFYRLILGPSLVYSCAYFSEPGDSLDDAQEQKLDLICRKLALRPGEHLLDIGCGWGSLVLHAAEHYGARATGVTLSQAQASLARRRAQERGLGDRVEIRVADYRELGALRVDKIASVGMYEHVGRAALGEYVRTCHGLLRPGGLMLNHGIARLDDRPPNPKTFIARYVFPDGELHPVAELMLALQTAGLEVRDVESLREHYPLTLRDWVANLRERRHEAEALVGPARARTWELYMIGSALAFETAQIGVYQVLVARSDGPSGLPLDRSRLLAPRMSAD